MGFRVVVITLGLCLLVVHSSSSPIFDSMEEEENLESLTMEDTPTSFKLRMKDGDETYEGEITIDKNKQTEMMHFDAHRGSEEADIVVDFKRNLTMYGVPARRVCLLARVDDDTPKPSELAQELERETTFPKNKQAPRPTTKWYANSQLKDRSILSDEMAILCDKYPIYLMKKHVTKVNVAEQIDLSRTKRDWGDWDNGIQVSTPWIDVDVDVDIDIDWGWGR